jgi:hypothetical protein
VPLTQFGEFRRGEHLADTLIPFHGLGGICAVEAKVEMSGLLQSAFSDKSMHTNRCQAFQFSCSGLWRQAQFPLLAYWSIVRARAVAGAVGLSFLSKRISCMVTGAP